MKRIAIAFAALVLTAVNLKADNVPPPAPPAPAPVTFEQALIQRLDTIVAALAVIERAPADRLVLPGPYDCYGNCGQTTINFCKALGFEGGYSLATPGNAATNTSGYGVCISRPH